MVWSSLCPSPGAAAANGESRRNKQLHGGEFVAGDVVQDYENLLVVGGKRMQWMPSPLVCGMEACSSLGCWFICESITSLAETCTICRLSVLGPLVFRVWFVLNKLFTGNLWGNERFGSSIMAIKPVLGQACGVGLCVRSDARWDYACVPSAPAQAKGFPLTFPLTTQNKEEALG